MLASNIRIRIRECREFHYHHVTSSVQSRYHKISEYYFLIHVISNLSRENAL